MCENLKQKLRKLSLPRHIRWQTLKAFRSSLRLRRAKLREVFGQCTWDDFEQS